MVGVSLVPVQMWKGWPKVPVRMWQGVSPVLAQTWKGEPNPGADVGQALTSRQFGSAAILLRRGIARDRRPIRMSLRSRLTVPTAAPGGG